MENEIRMLKQYQSITSWRLARWPAMKTLNWVGKRDEDDGDNNNATQKLNRYFKFTSIHLVTLVDATRFAVCEIWERQWFRSVIESLSLIANSSRRYNDKEASKGYANVQLNLSDQKASSWNVRKVKTKVVEKAKPNSWSESIWLISLTDDQWPFWIYSLIAAEYSP